MQVWKDRVSSKSYSTHLFALNHVIARVHDYRPGLHVNKQAVFAILMVDQNEIADVFGILAGREFWMPDLGCICVLEPIVRYVVNMNWDMNRPIEPTLCGESVSAERSYQSSTNKGDRAINSSVLSPGS
jgi:hypothetical protein